MISTDGTTTYAHDATDQLTGADHSYQADEAYAYDAAGNRSGADYDTAAANRLTSDGTFDYTYDDEGNLLTRTRISADPADDKIVEYQWDHRNRLIGVVNKDSAGLVTQQVQYTYDVFNNRIIKSVDADGPGPEQAASTHFIYDGEDIVAEFEKAGQSYDLTHRYLHGPGTDQILADEYIDDPTHGVYWALADHQGSVRDVVELDGSTAVIGNHIKYDSFGNIASQSAPGAEFRYSYTGREFDAETGLYYYRARYYDAATARFIGEDPLTFAAGDANFYRYVGNTPMTLTDPSGMCWEGIKSMATSTWNNVTSVANNIWNGVKSQAASVWNNASNTASSIANDSSHEMIHLPDVRQTTRSRIGKESAATRLVQELHPERNPVSYLKHFLDGSGETIEWGAGDQFTKWLAKDKELRQHLDENIWKNVVLSDLQIERQQSGKRFGTFSKVYRPRGGDVTEMLRREVKLNPNGVTDSRTSQSASGLGYIVGSVHPTLHVNGIYGVNKNKQGKDVLNYHLYTTVNVVDVYDFHSKHLNWLMPVGKPYYIKAGWQEMWTTTMPEGKLPTNVLHVNIGSPIIINSNMGGANRK